MISRRRYYQSKAPLWCAFDPSFDHRTTGPFDSGAGSVDTDRIPRDHVPCLADRPHPRTDLLREGHFVVRLDRLDRYLLRWICEWMCALQGDCKYPPDNRDKDQRHARRSIEWHRQHGYSNEPIPPHQRGDHALANLGPHSFCAAVVRGCSADSLWPSSDCNNRTTFRVRIRFGSAGMGRTA